MSIERKEKKYRQVFSEVPNQTVYGELLARLISPVE